MTYRYQFFTRCEELVPILYGVKLTKYEIYGSTKALFLKMRYMYCYHVYFLDCDGHVSETNKRMDMLECYILKRKRNAHKHKGKQ